MVSGYFADESSWRGVDAIRDTAGAHVVYALTCPGPRTVRTARRGRILLCHEGWNRSSRIPAERHVSVLAALGIRLRAGFRSCSAEWIKVNG
jgi:hypothetical protein